MNLSGIIKKVGVGLSSILFTFLGGLKEGKDLISIEEDSSKYTLPCCVESEYKEERLFTYSAAQLSQIENNREIFESMTMNGEKLYVPVVAHTFVDGGCCNDNATQEEIESEIAFTNANYDQYGFNVNLVLFQYNEHVDEYYDDDYRREKDKDLNDTYGVSGVINLFYMDFDNNSEDAQHMYFPPSTGHGGQLNMGVFKQNYLFDGWSLIHELGHFWGLYHPWYYDGVEDTPIQKNLEFGAAGYSILYNSGEGECDSFYAEYNSSVPDSFVMTPTVFKNAMQYGSRYCSQEFTPGQVDRMSSYVPERLLYLDLCLVDRCYEAKSFNNIVDQAQNVRASIDITTSDIINPSNRMSSYGANNEVILSPGFTAHKGSDVLVNNDGCSNACLNN